MADKSITEKELSELIKQALVAFRESRELESKLEKIYCRLFELANRKSSDRGTEN